MLSFELLRELGSVGDGRRRHRWSQLLPHADGEKFFACLEYRDLQPHNPLCLGSAGLAYGWRL
jgi:hypothetical protein